MSRRPACPSTTSARLLAAMPGPDRGAAHAVRAPRRELTKPPGALGRLEEIAEWLAAWQGRASRRSTGRWSRLRRQSRRRRAGRLGLSRRGDRPDGRELRGRRRGHQPDLRRLRSRPEGLRPRARHADRRHHRGAGDGRAACAATMAFGMEAIAGARSLVHRRDGHRQHHRRRRALAALFGGDGRRLGRARHGRRRCRARAQDRRRGRRRWRCHAGHLGDPLEVLRRLGGREIAAMAGRDPRRAHCSASRSSSTASSPPPPPPCCTRSTRARSTIASPATSRPRPPMPRRWSASARCRCSRSACGSAKASGAALAAGIVKAAAACHSGMATFAQAGVSEKGHSDLAESGP